MIIVFDSSTLILLAKTSLLRDVSEMIEIIVPEEVEKESTVKRTGDGEMISLLISEKNIIVHQVDEIKAIKKLQNDFRLAKGEAEALWLSRKYDYPLAIDDGPGIKASKVLGVHFLTAIHFLLHMAAENTMSSELAQEKLAKLVQYGRYSKRIIQDAMNRLSEGRK